MAVPWEDPFLPALAHERHHQNIRISSHNVPGAPAFLQIQELFQLRMGKVRPLTPSPHPRSSCLPWPRPLHPSILGPSSLWSAPLLLTSKMVLLALRPPRDHCSSSVGQTTSAPRGRLAVKSVLTEMLWGTWTLGVCESLMNDTIHYYPGGRALGGWEFLSSRLSDPELEESSERSSAGPRSQSCSSPATGFCSSGPDLCFHFPLPCSFLLPRVPAATPFPSLVNFTSVVTSPPRFGSPVSIFVENQNFWPPNFTSWSY